MTTNYAYAGSYAAHSEMLRTEKGRRKGTESAQRDKPIDGSRREDPSMKYTTRPRHCTYITQLTNMRESPTPSTDYMDRTSSQYGANTTIAPCCVCVPIQSHSNIAIRPSGPPSVRLSVCLFHPIPQNRCVSEQNFSTANISDIFVGARPNLAALGVLVYRRS